MRVVLLQTVGGVKEDGDAGGGVIQLAKMAHEWSNSGEDVHFITNEGDKGNEIYHGITSVHRLRSLNRSFFLEIFFNFMIQIKQINSLIMQESSIPPMESVVVTTSPYPSDVLAAWYVGRKHRLRCIINFHHVSPPPWQHPFKRGGLTRSLVNFCMNQLMLILAKIGNLLPSIDNPEELARLGWSFQTGILKNYCVLAATSNCPNINSNNRHIACFVGRVAVNKGVIDLLLIWKKVVTRMPDAKLIIAGKVTHQRLENRLWKLRKRLHLEENVNFIFRHVSYQEKISLLCSSNLFVFPSYEEGWSLSVMEAASVGVLPITYDLPAYSYLGPTAVRAKVGSIDSFADLVMKYFSEESTRVAIATELKRRVLDYSPDRISRHLIEKYRQFVETGSVR